MKKARLQLKPAAPARLVSFECGIFSILVHCQRGNGALHQRANKQSRTGEALNLCACRSCLHNRLRHETACSCTHRHTHTQTSTHTYTHKHVLMLSHGVFFIYYLKYIYGWAFLWQFFVVRNKGLSKKNYVSDSDLSSNVVLYHE